MNQRCVPSEGVADSMPEHIFADSIPEDIFERIFLELPLGSIFRIGSVCRNWKALLSSAIFLKQWMQMGNDYPHLFLHKHFRKKLYCFCFLAGTWKRLALPESPLEIDIYKGSARHLVLIDRFNFTTVVLYNRLMQTTFRLPPMLRISSIVTKCIARGNESYKMVAMGHNQSEMGHNQSWHLFIEMYDFSEKSWMIASEGFPKAYWPTHMVYCTGFLFCSNHQGCLVIVSIRDCTSMTIEALPERSSSSMTIEALPERSSSPAKLVEWRGSVLVVLITKEEDGTENIVIWQLIIKKDLSSLSWKKIAVMPPLLLKNFHLEVCYVFEGFYCTGVEDYICFVSQRKNNDIVVYNLQTGHWNCLPEPPY